MTIFNGVECNRSEQRLWDKNYPPGCRADLQDTVWLQLRKPHSLMLIWCIIYDLSKLQTALFNMQQPTFGINSLILSVSLIHIMVFHLLTTYPTHVGSTLPSPPLLPWITSLFTPDLKHTSSSLFHHRLLHRYSLDWSHRLPAGPFSLAHRICLNFTSQLIIKRGRLHVSTLLWAFKRAIYFFSLIDWFSIPGWSGINYHGVTSMTWPSGRNTTDNVV